MGLTVCIVLGMITLTIKLRWKLRKRVWFWVIIAFVRWPQGNAPTIAYTMPIGIADFLLIMGAIGLVEKFFSNDSSSDDEEE